MIRPRVASLIVAICVILWGCGGASAPAPPLTPENEAELIARAVL